MMKNLTNIKMPSNEVIGEALEILLKGGLVAFPTETVYGLGADATSNRAISSIYHLKSRPKINPLICHVASKEMAYTYSVETNISNLLANSFWPGPLTLILNQKKGSSISKLVTAELDSIAMRFPKNKVFEKIIRQLDKPIAAPSANISGNVSPTTPMHVFEEFNNKIELIIDGGETEKGIESTVVDARGRHPIILRHGPITTEMIESTIKGKVVLKTENNSIESPGQLLKHYSPGKKLIINSLGVEENSSFLGFKDIMPHNKFKGAALNLSVNGDLDEAAANLFKMIRILDKNNSKNIMVAPIPNNGVGVAINDKLKRAAQ